MEQEFDKNKKISLEAHHILYGAEHHINSLHEVQTYLMHYFMKIMGKSSREQAEYFTQNGYSMSHTTANDNTNKGEECFKSLAFLMKQIEQKLDELDKPYVTCEYGIKAMLLDFGIPKDKLQEAFEVYVRAETKRKQETKKE